MPTRINHSTFQNGSNSPNQSQQSSPEGLPRRSNSVSSPTSVDGGFPRGGRQKRRRYGSGASLGSSDGQQSCRKSRRNRPSAGNSIHETLPAAVNAADVICSGDFVSGGPRKCFVDSAESDSNFRIEAIKTVVEEVAAVQVSVRVDDDGSGTQTPQSNDEGNNSENEDDQVAKLPPTSFPDPESTCDSSNTVVAVNENIQRSLSSVSIVPCSISCDSSIPSTSSSVLPVDAAFRQQVVATCTTTCLPDSSLSSFSSVTSLVDTVLEPLSMILSAEEPVLSAQRQLSGPSPLSLFNESSTSSFPNACQLSSKATHQPTGVTIAVAGKRGKRKRKPVSRGNPKRSSLKTLITEVTLESDMDVDSTTEAQPHIYPLRSRIRQEQLRREWEERQAAPRQLDSLPFELILRIIQYLSVQDLFSLQCLNKRLKIITTRHLSTLKRINFSSGLPFAYLPKKLDDAALKRILVYTPEVTHILGFYPRRIYDNTSPELQYVTHALTYDGVFEAFRSCTKLRSVELMDVGLMSLLVNRLPNVKFHGMFRNRPDSWDSEYAVPMPPEPSPLPSPTPCSSTPSSTANDLAHAAASFVHRAAASRARLARWFEPVGEVPQLQGSPCCPQYTYLYPHTHRVFLQPHFHMHTQRNANQEAAVTESPLIASATSSNAGGEQGAYGSMMAFAIATAFVPPEGMQARSDFNWGRRVRGGAGSSTGSGAAHLRRSPITPLLSGVSAAAAAVAATGSIGDTRTGAPISPFPILTRTPSVNLPLAISNLTKLDLVSVAISVLPRLDNVKYLHLKWVLFTQQDPFASFQAGKLQSFVMNNCVGPRRYLRYVRVFAVLARAPQLARLELVGTRFIEGLLEQIVDRHEPPILCFRNLQRLVLAGNRDSTAVDAGLLLLAGQQSLVHVALQIWHTKNALFEALSYARVRLSRLESLILGYQDPYRARLTPTEALDLDLAESMESSLPYCTFTNRGLALVFPLCPRLSSLTIRHAPYITRFPRIDQLIPAEAVTPASAAGTSQPSTSAPVPPQFPRPAASTAPAPTQPAEMSIPSSVAAKVVPNTLYRSSLPLKSLTLENCPGITVSEIESVLAKGDPFGFLESLVLRDMFPLSRETTFMGPPYHWSQRWLLNPSALSRSGGGSDGRELLTLPDYRKLGLLLSIADLLSSRLVAYPPLSPVGIGMGASVRDVSHSATTAGLRVYELPVQPFDIFFTLRTHTYLTSLLQMDGTCGRLAFGHCRIHRLLLDPTLIDRPSAVATAEERDEKSAFFISRSTQTCVCGLLEWDFVQRLHVESEPSRLPPADPKDQGLYQHQHQLGGPLAFHPFPVLLQHNALYQKLICSDWADKLCSTAIFDRLRDKQRSFVRPLCGPGECLGCSSGLAQAPSETQSEPSLRHIPRVWTARDACVDTSELRQYVGPKPCVLTLRQPIASPLSCLTTLHFERVGLTHLVLSSVPRLKNITLENCPALSAILFHTVTTGVPATAGTASSSTTVFPSCISVKMTDPVPSLRRVRIIRCPKFAIYNWLGAVAALYPHHEENIFITFRPFGPYYEAVEQALWRNAKSAHVMISHDYSIDRSECAMEETNSAFEQRFREVISLTDSFHRRSPPVDPNFPKFPSHPRLFHSDEGADWSLLTDIAWSPQGALDPTVEVSLTDPQPPSYIVKSPMLFDAEDGRSRFEAFLAAYRGVYKFHRRGIHFHVQYRDVHEGVVGGDDSDYLLWPYSESYLRTVPPEDDLNAWGDGFNESWVYALPPHTSSSQVLVDTGNVSMLAAMEARLDQRKRRGEPDDSAEAPMVAEVKIARLETGDGDDGGL